MIDWISTLGKLHVDVKTWSQWPVRVLRTHCIPMRPLHWVLSALENPSVATQHSRPLPTPTSLPHFLISLTLKHWDTMYYILYTVQHTMPKRVKGSGPVVLWCLETPVKNDSFYPSNINCLCLFSLFSMVVLVLCRCLFSAGHRPLPILQLLDSSLL